ncbi:MAG: hypothetical protein IKV35_04365 [Clostridia bacterium]|nr:hypothetical protein [Clostridia bacterium]
MNERKPASLEEAPVSKKPLIADKDLFARWLFAWLLQVGCGVLAMLETVMKSVDIGSYRYIENDSIGAILKETAWHTTYTAAVVVFFAAAAMMAIPLVVDRLKRPVIVGGMLAVQSVFLCANVGTFYAVKPLLEQQTYMGFPWRCEWSTLGYIYLVVSAFAVLELVLLWRVLGKRAKTKQEGEIDHGDGH